MQKEIEEMEKAIRCLALELPEVVHTDVMRLWNNLKRAFQSDNTAPDAEKEE
jgi:hypothetical protein